MTEMNAIQIFESLKLGARRNYEKDGFIEPYAFLFAEGRTYIIAIRSFLKDREHKQILSSKLDELIKTYHPQAVGLVAEARMTKTGSQSIEHYEDIAVVILSYINDSGEVKHKLSVLYLDPESKKVVNIEDVQDAPLGGTLVPNLIGIDTSSLLEKH